MKSQGMSGSMHKKLKQHRYPPVKHLMVNLRKSTIGSNANLQNLQQMNNPKTHRSLNTSDSSVEKTPRLRSLTAANNSKLESSTHLPD